uniref:Uncharacterized protein n=1 Tax=Romanomermis culicivorax TaxID=13658 RepID=A0A915JYY6_ROMCU
MLIDNDEDALSKKTTQEHNHFALDNKLNDDDCDFKRYFCLTVFLAIDILERWKHVPNILEIRFLFRGSAKYLFSMITYLSRTGYF